jgi:hypothetical protein
MQAAECYGAGQLISLAGHGTVLAEAPFASGAFACRRPRVARWCAVLLPIELSS